MRIVLAIAALYLVVAAPVNPQTEFLSGQTLHNSSTVGPALIVWGRGIGGKVETITTATLGTRETWRVTHYRQDPTDRNMNEYDTYDVDRHSCAVA